MNRAPVLLVLLAIARPGVAQDTGGAEVLDESTRVRYERHAAAVTAVSVGDFIYGRPSFRHSMEGVPEAGVKAWEVARRDVEDRTVPIEPIVRLVEHPNPKVRTLAAFALFAREDHKLLPHIARLCADESETFAEPQCVSRIMGDQRVHPPLPQVVKSAAYRMVEFWTTVVDGRPDRFAEYWAPRKDRAYIASSFVVRLARAGWGVLPLQPACIEPIKAVRRAIDALPRPDRDWVLLWVCDHCWTYESGDAVKHLATDAELVAAAKGVGEPQLVMALKGFPPFADPDIQARPGVSKLARVILRNAAELIRVENVDVLLEKARTDEERSPLWIVAAAAVRPDRAQALLEDALRTFEGYMPWDRGEIAIGLWTIRGEATTDFLVNWFFSETAKSVANPGSNSQTFFMDRIGGIRSPADRKLVARIIRDPRLDGLGQSELLHVIGAVHRWTPFDSTYMDASLMAEWRAKLRASIPKWEKP